MPVAPSQPRTSLRVGVVGCGLIAQTMHLPYLRELGDRFQIAALCDTSPEVLAGCAELYGVANATDDWRELIGLSLDAVMVLTPVSHAPVAIAAASAGRHVFVEKPMAVSSGECAAMITAARDAGVQLMVGTMKRYDPAYERLLERLPELGELRLVQATTLESPLEPYVAHHPLIAPPSSGQAPPAPVPHVDAAAVAEALGSEATDEERVVYRTTLLDTLIHELNMLRGALGEPTEVTHARIERRRAGIHLMFGDTACHVSWVDLPGMARYRQDLAFHGLDARLELRFPSPFLRNAPTVLVSEGGHAGTAHAWRNSETVDFDEAFRRELEAFHAAVVSGVAPRTDGHDGAHDIALCEAIMRVHSGGEPVTDPTALEVGAA